MMIEPQAMLTTLGRQDRSSEDEKKLSSSTSRNLLNKSRKFEIELKPAAYAVPQNRLSVARGRTP